MNKTDYSRKYNMDIERVLLILMVIVLHYNNRSMGGALNYAMMGGIKEFILRFSESACICAVDAFLILSGYFSKNEAHIKVPYKKSIWLLAACSFYRVVGYTVYALFVTHDFSVRTFVAYVIPSNWFVCLFVTVLLLSPFIVRLYSGLEERAAYEFTAVIFGLFCIVPTITQLGGDILGINLNGLATISINGDIDGFNITAFVLCFCLGMFIKRSEKLWNRYPAFIYLIEYILCVAISAGISYKSEKVWSYSGLFCVICAFSFTLLFTRIRVSNVKVGKALSAVAGCSLGIFIWHTMPLMIFGYWVHLDIASVTDVTIAGYLGNMFVCVISMFALSFVWVYACRSVVGAVKNLGRNKGEA